MLSLSGRTWSLRFVQSLHFLGPTRGVYKWLSELELVHDLLNVIVFYPAAVSCRGQV